MRTCVCSFSYVPSGWSKECVCVPRSACVRASVHSRMWVVQEIGCHVCEDDRRGTESGISGGILMLSLALKGMLSPLAVL